MELTEANLRAYNDTLSSSSSSSGDESPEEQIQRYKEGIFGILRSLRRFGSPGLRCIDEADVYIDERGSIACRGGEPRDDDDAAFWIGQAEALRLKFVPLHRAVYGPPEDIVMDDEEAQARQDDEAQAEQDDEAEADQDDEAEADQDDDDDAQADQDRVVQYYASWKFKIRLFLTDRKSRPHVLLHAPLTNGVQLPEWKNANDSRLQPLLTRRLRRLESIDEVKEPFCRRPLPREQPTTQLGAARTLRQTKHRRDDRPGHGTGRSCAPRRSRTPWQEPHAGQR